MSEYENFICGKLRLKGKPLDIKGGGIKKKGKKHRHHSECGSMNAGDNLLAGEDDALQSNPEHAKEMGSFTDEVCRKTSNDHLTLAERRYLEQWQKIDMRRLAKSASKSHRDRILEFNQYLANLSEHYDIPKVGPG